MLLFQSLLLNLLACGEFSTLSPTRGEIELHSTQLRSADAFQSGDPLLAGSRFCLQTTGSELQDCASTESSAYVDIMGRDGPCFEMLEAGTQQILLSPLGCPDFGLSAPDTLEFDVRQASGMRAELRWYAEEYVAARVASPEESWTLHGPAFFYPGIAPPAGTPLVMDRNVSVQLGARVWDGEEQVAWAEPWRLEIPNSTLASNLPGGTRFNGEDPQDAEDTEPTALGSSSGGEIALVKGDLRLPITSWSPLTSSTKVRARLHVGIHSKPEQDWEQDRYHGAPSGYAWMELQTKDGAVVRALGTQWSMAGGDGTRLFVRNEPGTANLSFYCALRPQGRWEHVTVGAQVLGKREMEAFWVYLPPLPMDTDSLEQWERTCEMPVERGCAHIQGGGSQRGMALLGLLGALALGRRRE